MRVLWSVNTISPVIASKLNTKSLHSISWVEAMSARLKSRNDISLAIAFPGSCETLQTFYVDQVTYYVLPGENNLLTTWDKIISSFKPDIIHIYGTERKHNLSLIDCVNNQLPIVVSLQGIIAEYEKHYYGGMSIKDILKYYTIGDVILRQGILAGKKKFAQQKKLEAQILNNVSYFEGRSDWDRVMSAQINPNRKYYTCPRMIREPFFDNSWNIQQAEPHSLFVHQGGYPIKGLHFMMEALNILKKRYPDVKLYISGHNFLQKFSIKGMLTETGYIKYIKHLIRKYDLVNNIVFTGYLPANQLADRLSKVQACIVPSVIENAPNSLAEGMIVGAPCIASYVGGNAEMLCGGLGGYLYRFNEPAMLADRVSCIFDNTNDAIVRAEYGKNIARTRHDPDVLEKTLLDIYADILVDFAGKK